MGFEFLPTLLVLPVLLILWMLAQLKGLRYKTILNVAAIFLAAIYMFNLGKGIYTNLNNPPEWDFLTFWLDGQVAVKGQNFYDASNYKNVDLPYTPSEDFFKEIVDIGFRYPPFTMFLFLPLGYLDYYPAYLFWQILNAIFCLFSVYILWKLFLEKDGMSGLLFILAIFFMLRPTFSTFFFAQTNFVAFVLFLLYWWFKDKDWSGFFLALGFVVKPYLALIFLYPLFVRKWKQLFFAILSLVIAIAISGLFFSFDVVKNYLLGNSLGNMPAYVYSEPVNQSLLATILRSSFANPGTTSLLSQPLYIGLSLLLALVTFIVGFRSYKKDEWVLLSILFFAFLVYPATLEHYGVFLIIPVLLLLQKLSRTTNEQVGTSIIILIVYFLSGYKGGFYVFFANAFIWLICIYFELQPDLSRLLRRLPAFDKE